MARINLPKKSPNEYWVRRMIRESDELAQISIDEADAWLAQYYLELSERLIDKIDSYYFKILHDKPTDAIVSHKLDYNKYVDLFNEVQAELNKLGANEIKYLEKRFVDLYKNNSKLVDSYMGLPRMKLDDKAVRAAVNRVWCQDNKMWQQRVWEHTNNFKQSLMSALGDAVAAGTPVEQLEVRLKDELNINWYDARRIARTEMAHIQNQSSVDRYKEADIKYYQWLAGSNKEWVVKMTDKQIANLPEGSYIKNKLSRNRAGDKTISIKVCELCQSLDGQIFPIDDMTHIPPDGSHPNCRCVIVPVLNQGETNV